MISKVILWECQDTGHLLVTYPIGSMVPDQERQLHPQGDFPLEGESEEMYLDRIAMAMLTAIQQHQQECVRKRRPVTNGFLPERFQRLPDIYPMLLPSSRRYRDAWRWDSAMSRIIVDPVEAVKLRKLEIKRAKIAAYLEAIGVLTYEEELMAENDIHELLASEWPIEEVTA